MLAYALRALPAANTLRQSVLGFENKSNIVKAAS